MAKEDATFKDHRANLQSPDLKKIGVPVSCHQSNFLLILSSDDVI